MKRFKFFTSAIFLLCIMGTIPVHGMSWLECVMTAKKNNPSLTAAREKIKQKKANTGIAVSPMLPQTSTSISGSAGRSNDRDNDEASYSIGAKQLVFDGLKSVYSARSAKVYVDAAAYEYLVTESDVRLALRNAFVALLVAQENINITQTIVKRRKENFDLVSLRYDAGKEHRGSVLTAKANLSQARADLSQAGRNIHLARLQLSTTMGISSLPSLSAEGDITLADHFTLKPDFKTIASQSPLLMQMTYVTKALTLKAVSRKLAFFPSVYAYLNAGKSKSRTGSEQKGWSAGLEMSYPISDGGERYNNARKNDSLVKEAEAEMEKTRLSILFTLEDKWSSLQNSLENIEVSRQYLEAAEERSKIAEAQYSIGHIVFNNWTIIEDELVSAYKKHLNARASALYAEAEWIQAQGGTFNYDNK